MTDAVMPAEEWRDVVGWEGFYEVSDLGRVRSVPRLITRSDGVVQHHRSHIRKLHPIPPSNHLFICLRDTTHGRETTIAVHRLVAAAFIGPCPIGQEVRHGRNGRLDNRPTNLSYGTRSENMRDKRRDGTDPQLNKTHCPRGHLLQMPNLCKARYEKEGRRNCLSCQRAYGRVRWAADKGVELDFKAIADRYYEELMAPTAP